ncbi:hypothetical protein GCM10023191_044720 [Actinoallomurus oryzae]|uniref:Uncharacterized protein n=1 Tax=Actinoallomurus oryzae TaxID=502180 RepID=A0ABP8Q7V7_9ACTN
MRRGYGRFAALPSIGLALCLAGCGGGHIPASGDSASARGGAPVVPSVPAAAGATGPDGRPGCAPPSPIGTLPPVSGGGPEVRGTGHGAGLWGLIMVRPRSPLIRAGDEAKIVWRMTGTGDLQLSAIGPDGRSRKLAWGPEAHGGSSYHRPGEEWGAGYRFDRPGCWDLHAVRGTASADVWLKVAPRRRS